MQISIPSMKIWQKIDIFQIQDGGRTPYWKSYFVYISAPYWRVMRISERRWRITCRYLSRDQNSNFRKLKMADGRHFENIFISISWIIRFRSNSVSRWKFTFRGWIFDKNRNFSNSRWRTDAILKIAFLSISRRLIGRLTRNSEWDDESRADIGHVTKMEIFPNSWWRTAAILKTVFGVYVIPVMN